MECHQMLSQAQAYASEHATIQKNFQKYVGIHSYDDKAKHYETDMARVVGLLQPLHDRMKSQGCKDIDTVAWPSGVTTRS